MPGDESTVVSPADARMLIGSFVDTSNLFLKEKFFDLCELLGEDKGAWLNAFSDGDYAIFRLTPEKYHYNHVPVSGVVRDFYKIDGAFHSKEKPKRQHMKRDWREFPLRRCSCLRPFLIFLPR